MQVSVHLLHTLGALMGGVCIPRGVMEILTAQMAVMKWLVQVSSIYFVLPPSIDLNIVGTCFTHQLHATENLLNCWLLSMWSKLAKQKP